MTHNLLYTHIGCIDCGHPHPWPRRNAFVINYLETRHRLWPAAVTAADRSCLPIFTEAHQSRLDDQKLLQNCLAEYLSQQSLFGH